VNNGFVFLRYTIQAAFFSNALLLLDVGHWFMRWFKSRLHRKSQKYSLRPTPFVDDIPFDLGHRQAQALTMFAMGLFFSGTSPIQAVFTWLYFTTYYWVEKYNLAFVYNKEYDGVGIIYKPVIPLMMIILYLFEFMLIGFFTLQDKGYFFGGVLFVAI
jgi:hypothetical protein